MSLHIKIKTVLRRCHKVACDVSPVSVDFICYWLSKVSIEGPETECLSLYRLSLIFSETSFSQFTDINECADLGSNACSAMAACNNTFGSYVCLCLDGYEGDGKNCSGNFTILLLIALLGFVTCVFFFFFLHDLYTVKEAVVVTAITPIPFLRGLCLKQRLEWTVSITSTWVAKAEVLLRCQK